MASSTTRTPRSDLIRKATSSRVDWSDQCRSSSTSSKGRRALSRPSNPRTSSSSWDTWSPSAGRLGALVLGQYSARVELGQQAAQAAPGRAEYVGQFGPGRGASQCAQRVDERGERQALRAELDAVAGQHREPRVGCLSGQFRDQAGLAHAGLAGDDREARLAAGGSPQQCGQRLDLLAPPDEDRALDRLAHTCTVPQPVRAREPGTGNTDQPALSTPGGRAEPGHMTTTTDSLVREPSKAAGAAPRSLADADRAAGRGGAGCLIGVLVFTVASLTCGIARDRDPQSPGSSRARGPRR